MIKFWYFIPALIQSALNAFLPYVIKALVEFEKWDDPDTKNKNIIFRNFIVILLNLSVFIYKSYGNNLRLEYDDGIDYKAI